MFLLRGNKYFVVAMCVAFIVFVVGCDHKRQGRIPESERLSLQKACLECLEPLRDKGAKDAESLYEFTINFCSLARKYAITQEDVVEIIGVPVSHDKIAYEFEYQYPSCSNGISILVWFDRLLNVLYCFPAERPREYVVNADIKERLRQCYRELLLPLKGKNAVDSTGVDKRLKKMKMAFKEVLKSKTFTYRDVVDIMGQPTGPETLNFLNVSLDSVPYGKSFLSGGMLVVGYRFPLNESASAVLCFAFCESIGGCLGTVDTSWVETGK